MSKKISLTQLVSAVGKVVAFFVGLIKKQNETIATKVGDAPKDGKPYVRKDGGWAEQAKPESDDEFATDKEVEEAIDEILNGTKS